MLRAAVGALVATSLMVVAAPPTATGFPGGCTHTWDDGAGDDFWGSASNWSPNQVPGPTSVACIGGFTVAVNGVRTISQLHLDPGADVTIPTGAQILVTSSAASQWASGSQVHLAGGGLGGTGLIEVQGDLDVEADSGLASGAFNFGDNYTGPGGTLRVLRGALMEINDSVAYFFARYRLEISGDLQLNGTGRISADWGTAMTINPGGRFVINGVGGYYQGHQLPGASMSTLVNNGSIEKVSGGTPGTDPASIIEAAYTRGAGSQVEVDCCQTLAFASDQLVSGAVVPNMSLGTGVCGPVTTGVCGGSTHPAVDPSSVTLQMPAANSLTSSVQVQELPQPTDVTDSRAVGNDMYAHADQLDVDPANPATLVMRFRQDDAMSTPLSELQVGHIHDVTGVMTKVPDCVGGALPPGASYCLDRATLTKTIDTVRVTVLTTVTSRWRVRRVPVGATFDQTAPGAATGLKTRLASPGDGSAVKVLWTAPADDGGASPSYRVFRNGKQVATTTGATSVVVKNSGPGKHTFVVQAVNAIGDGPKSGSVTIKLDKISKPRKVTGKQGAAGGKLTAVARWKPPADAGGYVIKKYQIKAYTAGGKLVASKKVDASKRQWAFTLPQGRYVFKVRAKNVKLWGPWSKPSDVVRPR